MKKSLNDMLIDLGFKKDKSSCYFTEYVKKFDNEGAFLRGVRVSVYKDEELDKEDYNILICKNEISDVYLICDKDLHHHKDHKNMELNIDSMTSAFGRALKKSGLLTIDKSYYSKSLITVLALFYDKNKKENK